MRSIAIINQKGGVGKTTTAVNLSAALAEFGQRVCLIDLDPQAHASLHLGVALSEERQSVYHVLTGDTRLSQVRQQIDDTPADGHGGAAAIVADEDTDGPSEAPRPPGAWRPCCVPGSHA